MKPAKEIQKEGGGLVESNNSETDNLRNISSDYEKSLFINNYVNINMYKCRRPNNKTKKTVETSSIGMKKAT